MSPGPTLFLCVAYFISLIKLRTNALKKPLSHTNTCFTSRAQFYVAFICPFFDAARFITCCQVHYISHLNRLEHLGTKQVGLHHQLLNGGTTLHNPTSCDAHFPSTGNAWSCGPTKAEAHEPRVLQVLQVVLVYRSNWPATTALDITCARLCKQCKCRKDPQRLRLMPVIVVLPSPEVMVHIHEDLSTHRAH